MIRIRELRIERNMTQLELAMELDIGNTTLQQYETGLHEPNFDMLIKIADYFDVTIDYLIGRTRRPSTPQLLFSRKFGIMELLRSEFLLSMVPHKTCIVKSIF